MELRRVRYRRQIRHNAFLTSEPEFALLDQLVRSGDWVIDVGANVGHYTKRLSEVVGPDGRVIAVEPVCETFALLAANVALLPLQNVTLLNVAASRQTSLVGMQVPRETGVKNFYQAAVTASRGEFEVLTWPLDALSLPHRISLVKIDAEGHDASVLAGMEGILARDRPTLIVESGGTGISHYLEIRGYETTRLTGSPNLLCRAR